LNTNTRCIQVPHVRPKADGLTYRLNLPHITKAEKMTKTQQNKKTR